MERRENEKEIFRFGHRPEGRKNEGIKCVQTSIESKDQDEERIKRTERRRGVKREKR